MIIFLNPLFTRPAVHADLIEAFPIEAITFVPQEANVMKTGAPGDPRLATAEKGKAIVEKAVDVISELIEYLKKNYKPDECPKVKPDLKVDM